ncbi:serine/threonine-protein kinase [Streptomyces sp. NPDC013740]|uniref:serine/threonine-protein kinase n=1 Tax=Streptomyces sp. NPDC013740 TaxID=3364867 RepID=UPI0036F4E26C
MQSVGADDPAQVGPFRIVAVLGQGGMGRVLLGAAADGRLVAVKRVHADLAEDGGFRARFRREVDASRRVSGAYTAPVVDADPDAPTPWLASLYLPGPTLGEAVETLGPLGEGSVRTLAAGLARALADIHRAGLVHRDLKPSNVLLAEDGVRVLDFGIARAADHETRLTHTGALIGSPAFMSPEQVRGERPGPASDVFSLGVTLAVAATGRTPYAGASPLAVMHAVAHEAPDLGAVPPSLRGLVGACLAPEPGLRPTPEELLALVGRVEPAARPWPEGVHRWIGEQTAEVGRRVRALPAPAVFEHGAFASAGAPADPAATTPATARATRRRRRWLAAAVTAGVLAVTGGVLAATGVAADLYYTVVPEPVPTPGNVPLSQVADKYAAPLPACKELYAKVKAPTGFTPFPVGKDGGAAGTQYDGSWTDQCTWNSRSGDEISVGLTLYQGKSGAPTGAELAKRRHEGYYLRGDTARVYDLPFLEEALWYKPDGNRCVLYGRDVNMDLFVLVQGPHYPVGRCEALTEETGRQVMAAVSPR